MADFTEADLGSKGGDAKRPVPDDNATDPARREWLAWAFTVPTGWRVGEVTRYGATDHTPMTIEIIPPGKGRPRIVRLEEERDAAHNGSLRLALTRDAGLRAASITSAKSAGDAYYVLCKLARVVGSSDPLDEIREQVDGYRDEAKRLPFSFAKRDMHDTLDAIRNYPYSKRRINLWLAEAERHGELSAGDRPVPPLAIVTGGDLAGEWTSITHFGTYVRWGRDQPGTGRDDALAGRVVEIGGRRWKVQAWDSTKRDRRHRIETVLIRLPDVEKPPAEEGE